MWLFFSILAPFFLAIIHIIDAHCVEEIFEKPWFGAVTGSIATAVIILLILPFIGPQLELHTLNHELILIGLLAGAMIQGSQFLYFTSLDMTEVGIVSAYWNLVPAFVPIISFFVLNEILFVNHYLGILLLIVCSTLFYLVDTKQNPSKKGKSVALLMTVASLMQAIMFILQEILFNSVNYITGFTLISVGLIGTGIMPLLIPAVLQEIVKNTRVLVQNSHFFFTVEIVNLLAIGLSQRAVDLGIPSLVAAVESIFPAYVFILSALLLLRKKQSQKKYSKLPEKIGLCALMCAGVWLISI